MSEVTEDLIEIKVTDSIVKLDDKRFSWSWEVKVNGQSVADGVAWTKGLAESEVQRVHRGIIFHATGHRPPMHSVRKTLFWVLFCAFFLVLSADDHWGFSVYWVVLGTFWAWQLDKAWRWKRMLEGAQAECEANHNH